MSLASFFKPRALAIIGASSQQYKIGWQILDNIIKGGFSGDIYPINLTTSTIHNLKTYPTITELPLNNYSSLLVIIVIPAPAVLAEIRKCALNGVKNIIIISAGFKERDKLGAKTEKEIVKIAKKYKINILGPNCLGLINTHYHLNASFAKSGSCTGRIALLSQSGAIGSAALDWLVDKNIGLAYFISLGNKAVIDENDIFSYLLNDSQVDLVVAYLEEIRTDQKSINLLSRLIKKKPVAILTTGKSTLNTNKTIKDGLIRAGVIYLENLSDLFNLLVLAAKKYWLGRENNDLYLVSNTGGLIALSKAEINNQKIKLGGSFDLLGDADAKGYRKTLANLLANKKVVNVLVLLTPQTTTEPLKTAQVIVSLAKKYPQKLIITSFVGGETLMLANQFLRENNIPVFSFPEEAIKSFKKIVFYCQNKKKL